MDSRLVQPKFEIPLTEERGEFKLSELFNWKEKKKKRVSSSKICFRS